MVKVKVRKAGPSRPYSLDLPARCKVAEVQLQVAESLSLPQDRLKLVLHGQTLSDAMNGEATFVDFVEGDTMIAVVAPRAPPIHVQQKDGLLEDEDEDLKFKLRANAPSYQRHLARILQQKLKVPDIILMIAFSISMRSWMMIIAWFILAPLAHKWDLGPLYILATAFAIIFYNLGKREAGDSSAYSIFNDGFRELPGTLNAERLDRDIRAGQF